RLVPTLQLASAALVIAILFGLLVGSMAAFPVNRGLRYLSGGAMTLALATPTYWTATLVIYFVTRSMKSIPAGGTDGLASLILPASVLGFSIGGGIGRVVETALRETLTEPFMKTAYAKGLRGRGIY